METVPLKFFKMYPSATLPTRANDDDACWDIRASIDIVIPNNKWRLVPTGLKVELPIGWELQIRPRSGLAAYHGITVFNTPGTIDAGYRGEIGVILFNAGGRPFYVRTGQRIAQLSLKPVYDMSIISVNSEEELGSSSRGEDGFGSTGD